MELAEQTASHKGLAQASHLFLSYISLYTNAGTPSAREERFGEGGQRAKGPRTDGRRQGPRPVPLHSHQEDGSGPRQTGTIWHKGAKVQAVSDVCYRICNSVTHLLHDLARTALGISAGRSGTGVRPQCIGAIGGVPPVLR